MQVCPELRNLQRIAPATAWSRSASSKTMKGALPPSSSETFFRVFAHSAISIFPIAVEPVKPSLRTSGLDVISAPIGAASPVTTENTPPGIPASSPSTVTARAESGVWLAGFITIVQPAARAGAALRVTIAAGKFQGVIPAVTPIGCLRTTMRRSALGVGIVSP
jgi:hypothetical protein